MVLKKRQVLKKAICEQFGIDFQSCFIKHWPLQHPLEYKLFISMASVKDKKNLAGNARFSNYLAKVY